jgi:hypothetical protein
MKVVKYFLRGILLAVFSLICASIYQILIFILTFYFRIFIPFVGGMADLSNPWAYFIMFPPIALSRFFSRKTKSSKENIFEVNSLKEAFLEGFGWAAIQFGLLIAISTINLGLQGALEQFTVYLVSIGVFIGPLMDYVLRKFRNEAAKEKKGAIIAMILVILLSEAVPLSLYLYSISSNTSSNISSSTSVNKIGNTGGNIANGGEAALQGDWIYYSNENDSGKLYKINIDGTGKTKIFNDQVAFINVEGDWIYYTDYSDHARLCKIKTDGTEKTNLSDFAMYLNVIDDWIYYSYNGLYKIKTDGTGKTKLSSGLIADINVDDDWIYYCNAQESSPTKRSGEIYKIKTDGTENTMISDDNAVSLNVVGDWIYYGNIPDEVGHGDFGELYKIKTDGTGKTKLSSESIGNINVVGDWIYYSNGKLYKIKTDGTGKTKLNDDSYTSNINVVNDWIYYEYYYYGMFRIRTDGSGRSRV